jgi:hypothetical protein
MMIAICCFFVSGVLRSGMYVFVQANDDNDEKIITLALPTLKATTNQQW